MLNDTKASHAHWVLCVLGSSLTYTCEKTPGILVTYSSVSQSGANPRYSRMLRQLETCVGCPVCEAVLPVTEDLFPASL